MELNYKKLSNHIRSTGYKIGELCAVLGINERTFWKWKKDGYPRTAVYAFCYLLSCTERDLGVVDE